MKKYYLLLYCVVLSLLLLISEVVLVKKVDKQDEVQKLQLRYKVDDPYDLIDSYEEDVSESQTANSNGTQKLNSRVLRDRETTTYKPISTLDCKTFEKAICVIKGVSDFNVHYQLDDSNLILSCISSSPNIFELCQYGPEIKKSKFLDFPVLPVLKLQNKKVLEVGTKFFFVDKSENPVNVDPDANFESAIVSKLSVRLSGDCKINKISMSSPYQISVKSTEKIGVFVKNVKSNQENRLRTISGDSTIILQSAELDGNHFLLCGDKSSLIAKVDIPIRNCVSKYSEEPKKIFFCTNYFYFKWIFVTLVVFFPITWILWKTKNLMSLWYDILGIITSPILWIINYAWIFMPFKCAVCGCFSFLTHECSDKCVCNQNKASVSHLENCFLSKKNKKEWKKMNLIQYFQFIINTKISTNFLVFLTKIIIASILISYLPSSLAYQKQNQNFCVEKCYYSLDLSALTTDKNGYKTANSETCECSIGNVITETIYRDEIPISRATTVNDCVFGSNSCYQSSQPAKNLFACRHGCNALMSTNKIPDVKFNIFYKGDNFDNNLENLKIANRLRNGYMDSFASSLPLEEESAKEINYYSLLKIDDIPPENLMPRQSLVFSTEVDGKYRYMIEMDIKGNTGSIYTLSDDTQHVPMEFMIYVKSVGVEYDVKYKYSTSKIDTTVSDYLVTCTGKCSDCIKQKPLVGKLDFCVMPTSWWGCEEVGCLAINEGAICGHCTNVYDLSSLINIYQIVSSHVVAEVCIKSLDGYNCKKHSDRSPIQTDYYQLDMTVDLHNDYMSTDKLFAVTKQQKIYIGNIADLGDFSSTAFGHPQITIEGVPISIQSKLSRSDFTWSCTAIGEKKINIQQCGMYTYGMFYTLTQAKDDSILDSETNKLYMRKDFLAGKLKVIVDMPKEMFKKVPVKPSFSEIKSTCSGCIQCAIGINCTISYVSDTTFSSRLMLESCSFKSDQIGTYLGPNKKEIKMFCSNDITDKIIILLPEDQEELSIDIPIDEFVKVDQDTIIHFDDKSAHDESKHHSDTSMSSIWDWIKAPFNWVASFFGVFFDIVRIILVILVVCLCLYILSYIFKLSKSYYYERKRNKNEDFINNYESSVLLSDRKTTDTSRKRTPPPPGYQFSLDL